MSVPLGATPAVLHVPEEGAEEDVRNALMMLENCPVAVTHGGSRCYLYHDYEAIRRRLVVAIGKLRDGTYRP